MLSIVALLIATYALVNAFLWYSHARTRDYGIRSMIRSFNSLVASRTYKIVVFTAVWIPLSVGLFLFVFFPLWKLSVARPLHTAITTMGERFENEVTGSDGPVAAVCGALAGPAITLFGTVSDLRSDRTDPAPAIPIAPVRTPPAGLVLLAAIVLTFAVPVGLALAILGAAGSASYRVITADRQPSRTLTTRITDPTIKVVNSSMLASEPQPRDWPAEPPVERRTREDDTLIDHIQTEPDDENDPLMTALEKGAATVTSTGTGRARREQLEKFVDYDYQAEPVPENQSFGDKGGKLPKGPRKFRDEPDKDRKFLREPRKQTLPEKSKSDDEDFTIFDNMKDD
jgi:hypothetical protein